MTEDEYKDVFDAIDGVITSFRDELNTDERILRPLQQARDTAKTRYDDLRNER